MLIHLIRVRVHKIKSKYAAAAKDARTQVVVYVEPVVAQCGEREVALTGGLVEHALRGLQLALRHRALRLRRLHRLAQLVHELPFGRHLLAGHLLVRV